MSWRDSTIIGPVSVYHHVSYVETYSRYKQEPIFRGRQGAVLVHSKLARGPRLPIHAPRRHPGVERRLEGRDQLLKLVERHAREIQKLHRTGLALGEPQTLHES